MAAKTPEGSELRWLANKLKGKPDPEAVAEREAIVSETLQKVSEVAKLREDVLENRNFPIATFLQGKPIAPAPARVRRAKAGG